MISEEVRLMVGGAVWINSQSVVVKDEKLVRGAVIDKLVEAAVFGSNQIKPVARWLIWEIAIELGIYPSSIHPLYLARGRKIVPGNMTVPAMNFRGMAYDTSRALFATAVKNEAKAFICELARGEMSYTDQSAAEYVAAMLSGAIKEGYQGPIFIQGDHFQTKCSQKPGVPDKDEVEAVSRLIKEAIAAGFYNIDIDASTLVDLAKPKIEDQQGANIHYTAELLKLIRSLEPAGITISVGGEIGHIGGRNSTVEDFVCFAKGLKAAAAEAAFISKISVATGTSHGGVVNPDGSVAKVAVDFDVLKKISRLAKDDYQMAGAVQHGASTLPDEMLHKFAEVETAEIHLATGFQNYLMDDEAFPKELLSQMYRWLDETQQDQRQANWTDEQFHYKLRKKCWGKFKKEVWQIPEQNRQELRKMLSQRFELIFTELAVIKTAELIDKHIPTNPIHKEMVDFELKKLESEVVGLAD